MRLIDKSAADVARAKTVDLSDAGDALRMLLAASSREGGQYEPVTLGRGLPGLACMHAVVTEDADVASTLLRAGLKKGREIPVRGSGLFIGSSGLLIAARIVSAVAPSAAGLESVARARTTSQEGWDTCLPTDWVAGLPGIAHLMQLTQALPPSPSVAETLRLSLTNGLERLTIEPPQDMRPLSYAHGLAGNLSALASLAPADPALPQAARRVVELSYQTSGGPLKWVPSSWCAGHAGVSIAVLRTAIETDDTELLKMAWDLFQHGMDAGTPEKDPLSLCHGLGGSVAMAGAFANHVDNADAMFRSLTTRLMVEVEQFEVKPDTNIELASGVTGALVALSLSNSAQAQRLVELLLGVPVRSVA